MEPQVVVVIGAGGMGGALARRLGAGRHLVLADRDQVALDMLATSLADEGFETTVVVVDVSDGGSVHALANSAAACGSIIALAHTAGVSPIQASVTDIFAVDMVGTALVIDAFEDRMAGGGAAVVVASMAATLLGSAMSAEEQRGLALTRTRELRDIPSVRMLLEGPDSPRARATAYGIAKRANQLRVQSAAPKWGARQARINSISPGIIATPMGRAELSDGSTGEMIAAMAADAPAGRLGTVTDVAAVADFLLSRAASYISGADILVDGGVVASMLYPKTPAPK
ncbi:SDR family oxidoreductase [Mycobacterium yunnanensis]|uniref:SDR family oxidoreductase n=1 Tax=Mycobacterium yunnanensis TaxID=368477 RepID=A0A9X3C3X8_9MYCO|nr:SDR family oxidoreductase [Mycobacterium yunnanensis]MCV7423771.1 SDR family oxidoreductase [Mycobacterium yunnanensis]